MPEWTRWGSGRQPEPAHALAAMELIESLSALVRDSVTLSYRAGDEGDFEPWLCTAPIDFYNRPSLRGQGSTPLEAIERAAGDLLDLPLPAPPDLPTTPHRTRFPLGVAELVGEWGAYVDHMPRLINPDIPREPGWPMSVHGQCRLPNAQCSVVLRQRHASAALADESVLQLDLAVLVNSEPLADEQTVRDVRFETRATEAIETVEVIVGNFLALTLPVRVVE